MKRTSIIIAIMLICAAALWAGCGMSLDWTMTDLSHSDGSFAFSGIGGSLTFNPTWKQTGLRLTSHIGVATTYSSSLDGEQFSSIRYRQSKTWNYHASLGIGYEMPTEFGLRADVHAYWNDTTFTEGARLTEWDRVSYHVLGWGLSAGMFLRQSSSCIIGFDVSRDQALAACSVSRGRHDWDTSKGTVSRLSDVSSVSWKISLTITAEI